MGIAAKDQYPNEYAESIRAHNDGVFWDWYHCTAKDLPAYLAENGPQSVVDLQHIFGWGDERDNQAILDILFTGQVRGEISLALGFAAVVQ